MMRTAITRLVLLYVCAAFVSACGTSPPTHFYALSPPAGDRIDKTDHVVVGVGPLLVADYLQRPQIVLRDANSQLRLGEFDRWAELPDRAITRWLVLDIDRQFARGTVVESAGTGAMDYRVRGQILQWDVDATSRATLVAQWEIVDRDGKAIVRWRTSRFNATVGDANDYSAVVGGLNATLSDFADEIAGTLIRSLSERGETSVSAPSP